MTKATFFASLARKKTVDENEKSELARVLTLIDLSALGVGSTLGLGVYILAGDVAKNMAGPAVVLSFLVAAIASAFAGLCYAEFAARVPKAGSAYVYSYVTAGEFIAYIIGWNLIMEYVIGTASVARGLSGYIDALTNNVIQNATEEAVPMHIGYLAKYPDFLAFGFIILLTVLLCIGVEDSSRLNNLFTALNLTTVMVMIVSGIINADPHNWNISQDEIPPKYKDDAGAGGFFPFGVAGVMAGAAKCFFGFVGFDAVATTGEEAINPQRNIPLAIVISLIVIFLAYFGISATLTLMWPYYDQDAAAPFPYVFDQIGWITVKWIVTSGACIALCTSLLGAMFPLPRIIYAMANDGLIFKFLAKIHPKTHTPLRATFVSGLLVSIMAILFDTDQLINMMSIGTLLAYTIVAVCVLILRYQPVEDKIKEDYLKSIEIQRPDQSGGLSNLFKALFNLNRNKEASQTSTRIVNWSIGLFSITALIFDSFVIFAIDIFDKPYIIILFAITTIVLIGFLVIIARQPTDDVKLSFKVPWVPLIPCVSVVINFYLMLELDVETWERFIIWLVVGFLIYFFYGIKNSEERKLREKQQAEQPTMDTKF